MLFCLLCVFFLETALTSFDVLLGRQHAASDVITTGLDVDAFTLCHRYNVSSSAAAGMNSTAMMISCDDDDSLQTRYVAVIRRGTDVTLQFCELEVVAAAAQGDD